MPEPKEPILPSHPEIEAMMREYQEKIPVEERCETCKGRTMMNAGGEYDQCGTCDGTGRKPRPGRTGTRP